MRTFIKRCTRTRTRKLVILASLAILIAAGTALAAWLVQSDYGSSKGKVGALSMLTLEINASNITAAPGVAHPGDPVDMNVKVTNPVANGALTITQAMHDTISPAIPQTDKPGCDGSNFTKQSKTGLNIPLPASATPQTITIPGLLKLNANAPTECQGATVTVGAVQLTASAG